MTVIEQELPAQVRALVDEHLDGLERVLLTAGISRPQRQAICEDVELQVREMLWQRSQAAPTVEEARAVLAELDPPEAFLEAVGPAIAPAAVVSGEFPQRTHILALLSASVPVLGVMMLFSPLGRGGEPQALVLLTCAEIVAILFGMVAIREIRRFPERWTGIGLSVFGILALPLVVVNFLAYMLLAPKYYHLIVDKARAANVDQVSRKNEIVRLKRETDFRRMKPGTNEPVEKDDELSPQARKLIDASKSRIASLQKANKETVPTPTQQLLYENRKLIDVATHIVVMILAATGSALLFVVAHRRCLPPAAT